MVNTRTAINTGNIDFYTYDPFTDKWVEVLYNGKIYNGPISTNVVGNSQPTIDKIVYLKDRTITVWNDGSTVEAQRMENDPPNKEYSLFVCILKKKYGSWSGVEKHFLNPVIEDAKVIEP